MKIVLSSQAATSLASPTPAADMARAKSAGPDPAFAGRIYVAAVARAGTPLFISGLTAARPDGTAEGATVAAQAREIFAQLAESSPKRARGPPTW